MGCANSKTGATGAAPENEEGAAPPKVTVDGEGQDGAANGNAVSCSNGADESTGEKEACNGDVKNNEESEAATPGGEKASEQNGGEQEESTQDGGEGEEAKEEEAGGSENAESRENNEEEEKAE